LQHKPVQVFCRTRFIIRAIEQLRDRLSNSEESCEAVAISFFADHIKWSLWSLSMQNVLDVRSDRADVTREVSGFAGSHLRFTRRYARESRF
jgi:hypothetical protein